MNGSADLPIPEDVKPNGSWPPFMVELADHIGAFDTLRFIEAFGGQQFYFPIDWERSRAVPIIGPEKARILSSVFAPARIELPTGALVLKKARIRPVMLRLIAGELTGGEAARMLKVRRSDLRKWERRFEADEGAPPKARLRHHDPRQISMFGGDF